MSFRPTIRQVVWLLTIACVSFGGTAAQAELPIDVEVAMQSGVPLTAPQQWAKLLGKMGLGRVRLRSGRSGEQPEVTKNESTAGARFKVVAILSRRSELLLPDRRYRAADRKALEDFFQALAQQESFGEELGRFDLTEKQFRQVHGDLSRIVDFSTAGITLSDMLDRLEQKFNVPVLPSASAIATLHRAEPLTAELRGMSAGTALAIALRKDQLALRPEKLNGEPMRMVIELHNLQLDQWPVGWKHEGSPRTLAPKMFKFLTIEIDGYTLSKAVDALEPRLGVTVVYDERILAERDIQPNEIDVKLPAGKTFLKKAVDRLLSQARLAGELRVDEQGRPFYWVTQFGKGSLRAK